MKRKINNGKRNPERTTQEVAKNGGIAMDYERKYNNIVSRMQAIMESETRSDKFEEVIKWNFPEITEPKDEKIRKDIIEFIKKLQLRKPILYGFSDGGIVGILIAIKVPNFLSKLIVSGANLNPKGIKKKEYLLTKIVYLVTRNKLFKMMLN